MKNKPRLLIVDDEPSIRRILQVAFEKCDYVALIAEDADQATRILEQDRIDCVITDVTMPGRTGYELLKEIRTSNPELRIAYFPHVVRLRGWRTFSASC